MRRTSALIFVVVSVCIAAVEGQRATRKWHTRRSGLTAETSFISLRDALAQDAKTDDMYETVLNIDRGRRHLDNIEVSKSSGLPQSCLTYEERYAPYKSSVQSGMTLGSGNQQIVHSKYVVILQMHKVADRLKEDLILSIRALAREVQSVGFHFYILFQVPTSMGGELTGQAWNHEQVMALLPSDFRDVTLIHDAKEEYELYYPKIAQNSKVDTLWGPGARAPHAGMSVFMNRYQSYEFAYALEYDVRLTGHWGRFLASALQIGIQARGSITEGLSGVETDHEVIGRLPEGAVKGLPDLIAFEVVWQSDKWLKSQVGFDFTMLEEMKAMVYGGSRRLFDKMHEVASEGRNIYIESLLPALSTLIPGGKRIVLKIPTEGESFHCNSADGLKLYKKFLTTSTGQCTSNFLIHPVKNEELWWREDVS